MAIGKIVNLPMPGSSYARVRDEYGTEYTVHGDELKKGDEIGDDFAYRVDVFHNESGIATTLKREKD